MNVYISSHDMAAANDLAFELTLAGHTVISTWHEEQRPESTPPEWWATRARENFHRIAQSDALVLIGGDSLYPGGKYVEAGYAHGRDIPVYNLGEVGNGMMHFARAVADVPALVAVLS